MEGWGEALIDHPAWFGRVEHYLGAFTPFVHEMFVNLRGPGGYIGCHSGGPRFDDGGRIPWLLTQGVPRTPWHPAEDPSDPLQIRKVP